VIAPQPENRKRLRQSLIVFAVTFVILWLLLPFLKQTLPGQLIRSATSRKPAAQLWADDLADDVCHKQRLQPLQTWANETLALYRSGRLTNVYEETAFCGPNARGLYRTNIPSWLNDAWWGEAPEVAIRLSESGEAECVGIGWYLSGILVGDTNYVTTFEPWYIVNPKPGIYTYSLYK
jgi:hypothetical protein